MMEVCLYLLQEIQLDITGSTIFFFFNSSWTLISVALQSNVFVLGFSMMFSSESSHLHLIYDQAKFLFFLSTLCGEDINCMTFLLN